MRAKFAQRIFLSNKKPPNKLYIGGENLDRFCFTLYYDEIVAHFITPVKSFEADKQYNSIREYDKGLSKNRKRRVVSGVFGRVPCYYN